ncbi:unnamed protein product [Cylindrotheca closterium]|uniref:Uncharacterized protein n=1 Tax=Cylindrotheca closterium TaxID=2856 RepID=A0AAD2GAS7_9STRA|nr:unnamed protein product [Cylindrotheca closterium]
MSNPSTNNIVTIPESPPPPLPLMRQYSNPKNHLDGSKCRRHRHHSSADGSSNNNNKYTTPSRLVVTTARSPMPEARQDASSSYEIRTPPPPQEHRSLVSKDSHVAASLRQPLSWSPHHQQHHQHQDVSKSGSIDITSASPLDGWPQRSPMEHDDDADVASFALFTQSFDTISESGHYFREADATATTTATTTTQGDLLPRKLDLKPRSNHGGHHQKPHAKEDALVGNLSPIQLGPEESTPPPARAKRSAPPQVHYPHQQYHPHPQPPFDPYHGYPPPPHPDQPPTPYYQYDGTLPPPPPPLGFDEGYGYSPPPPPGYDPRGPPPPPTAGHYPPPHPPPHVATMQRSNPFYVLRTAHRAFLGCSYLLPCLENREVIPIHLGAHSSFRLLQDPTCIPDAHEVIVAKQRVETAICTFGGQLSSAVVQKDAIFRRRLASNKSSWKKLYDDRFHGRYVVKPTHIDWRLEENPPVHYERNAAAAAAKANRQLASGNPSGNPSGNANGDCEMEEDNADSMVSVVTLENNQQKMKYRCKLCGQLKQNHSCPYQQSLQRSIGINVYPAVNAFTAREPGRLTKSLSEMNNFVSYESSSQNAGVPKSFPSSSYVTPETKARDIHSSPSSLTTVDSMEGKEDGSTPVSSRIKSSKRRDAKPFVKTLTLRQEHFRAVTPMASEGGCDYQYPHVPLSFRERKRLSDTLFFLSKEIPDMTVPVASLLRTARSRNEWDLCVAELLTQIVVGLYCREGDHRLDGLQDYLLRLGVAC